jgi:hypothetical protein
MKNINFILTGIAVSFFLCINLFGQNARIAYPINGQVLQQNLGGNINVHIVFQADYFTLASQLGMCQNYSYIYKIEEVDLQTGNNVISTKRPWTALNSSIWALSATDFKGFKDSISLSKGWFKITLGTYCNSPGGDGSVNYLPLLTSKFGVGDIYFVAGQSNASGFDYNFADNAQNYVNDNSVNQKDAVRFIKFKYVNKATYDGDQNQKIIGLPFNKSDFVSLDPNYNPFLGINILDYERSFSYEKLTNGTSSDNNKIYPRGAGSWYWSYFADQMASQNSTPVMIMNYAVPSTSVDGWQSNTDQGIRFSKGLRLHGFQNGVKAILWHQGEEDMYLMRNITDQNLRTNAYNTYKSNLQTIIANSRSNLGNSQLPWFISKLSYVSLWPYDPKNPDIVYSNLACNGTFNFSSNGGFKTGKITSTIFKDKQGEVVNSGTKLFLGTTDADDIAECDRADWSRIHFTGINSSLSSMGTKWKNAVSSNYNNASPILGKGLINLVASPLANSMVKLEVPTGFSLYRWVKNSGSPYETVLSTTNSLTISDATQPTPDIYVCYVSNSADINTAQFQASTPFITRNWEHITQSLVNGSGTLSFGNSAESKSLTINSQNVVWELKNLPTWISLSQNNGGYGVNNLTVTANSNTGPSRSASIKLKKFGSEDFVSYILINQSGSASLTTSLTSLNPTNSSSEWQGYGTARFNGTSIDGNTINIGGTLYTQGIGTHANSRIVYNLNNAYSTFSCKFGMDQESNCCDGATFTIKADGQTIYGPVTKVWGQVATVVSDLSVVGKNTLELITDQISNNYADHTDWADVYLQSGGGGCGTPPIAPTSVSASPSSISSGGSSTLSASCAYGTVTWSTGATGGSISVSPGVTTNYTVKCVSAGCPDSPVVGVTVTVSNSPCSVVTDNLNMGTWTVSNHPLVVRYFNNQYWLTQRIGTNPEKFLVRGSNMLSRSDVNLINNTYANLTSCFAWQNSNYGGLAVPNTTQFPTPSGFTLAYEPDNTPFYTANGSCGLTAPTNVAASPGSISSGQSSTLSATCANGTRLWSTGATSATIVVNPTSTTTYTVKCTQAGCPDSPTSSVTVQVGPCAALSHNLVMGTWNVTGNQLVAKNYHNQWWLVQRIGTSPEKFLVRGAEMLSRSDVALVNGTYSNLVGCFSWPYSSYGGLATPNSTTFPTPSGWQYGTEPDGTPFYTSTGGARLSSDIITVEETIPRFISVYPNPNQGAFVVKVYLESESSLDIDLINSSGKIYQSIKYNGVEGQNEIPFTTENISGGNYLIRVKTKDKVQSTTVVIK